MKNTLLIIYSLLAFSVSFGQSFEGKLTYKVEFEVKTKKIGKLEITKEQVIEKMKKYNFSHFRVLKTAHT